MSYIGLWDVRISISGVGECLGVMINVGCMNEWSAQHEWSKESPDVWDDGVK